MLVSVRKLCLMRKENYEDHILLEGRDKCGNKSYGLTDGMYYIGKSLWWAPPTRGETAIHKDW